MRADPSPSPCGDLDCLQISACWKWSRRACIRRARCLWEARARCASCKPSSRPGRNQLESGSRNKHINHGCTHFKINTMNSRYCRYQYHSLTETRLSPS